MKRTNEERRERAFKKIDELFEIRDAMILDGAELEPEAPMDESPSFTVTFYQHLDGEWSPEITDDMPAGLRAHFVEAVSVPSVWEYPASPPPPSVLTTTHSGQATTTFSSFWRTFKPNGNASVLPDGLRFDARKP